MAKQLNDQDRHQLHAQLRAAYEAGAINLLRLADDGLEDGARLSTGVLALDRALGTGGFPGGSLVEMYGEPSAGKSSLALLAIAFAQRRGIECALIDTERTFTPQHARLLGVDTERLVLVRPETGENALEIMLKLMTSRTLGLIALDSCAALLPQAEVDGAIGSVSPDAHARLIGRPVGKLKRAQGRCVCLLVNQMRNTAPQDGTFLSGSAGGPDLKRHADIRVDLVRTGKLARAERIIGQRVAFSVQKNVYAAPFGQGTVDFVFAHRFFLEADALSVGLEMGIIRQGHDGFWWRTERLGGTRAEVCTRLRDAPDLFDRLRNALRARIVHAARR